MTLLGLPRIEHRAQGDLATATTLSLCRDTIPAVVPGPLRKPWDGLSTIKNQCLQLAALTENTDAWPWGIWSDGESLVVTDTHKGYVLVWDSFPTDENSAPTSSSDPEGVGTPRNITSDGSSFLIGDENGSQPACWGEPKPNRNRQSHIWVNRLPIGAPDGCIWDWHQGDVSERGMIALAAGSPSDAMTIDAAVRR